MRKHGGHFRPKLQLPDIVCAGTYPWLSDPSHCKTLYKERGNLEPLYCAPLGGEGWEKQSRRAGGLNECNMLRCHKERCQGYSTKNLEVLLFIQEKRTKRGAY